VVLNEMEVRAAQPEERDRVRGFLGKEHYLGAGRDVGRTLVRAVVSGELYGRYTTILAKRSAMRQRSHTLRKPHCQSGQNIKLARHENLKQLQLNNRIITRHENLKPWQLPLRNWLVRWSC
jgi:hypothetical protein